MPRKPPTPCREPRCPALVDKPGRCPKHQREYDRERRRREPWRSAYNANWRRIRAEVLAEQPLCPCGQLATDVHHLRALRRGGTHDRWNLLALCKKCHARAAREARDG